MKQDQWDYSHDKDADLATLLDEIQQGRERLRTLVREIGLYVSEIESHLPETPSWDEDRRRPNPELHADAYKSSDSDESDASEESLHPTNTEDESELPPPLNFPF